MGLTRPPLQVDDLKPKMKVLLFGGSGMLGSDVQSVLGNQVQFSCPAHSEVDVTDQAQVDQAVSDFNPDAILNCAAYTDVEGAEDDPRAAWQLNAHAVANLACAARDADVRLIHISTDYVFDGMNALPLKEDAPCRPLSAYGRSKRAGELACLAILPANSLIVRTSWLFGGMGPHFVSTMLRAAAERDRMTVIADQLGSPTYTKDLAHCLGVLTSHPEANGVVHARNSGSCSWYEFAQAIVDGWTGLGNKVLVREMKPIKTHEWPSKAQRPMHAVLSINRLDDEFSFTMPSWRDALSRHLHMRIQMATSA